MRGACGSRFPVWRSRLRSLAVTWLGLRRERAGRHSRRATPRDPAVWVTAGGEAPAYTDWVEEGRGVDWFDSNTAGGALGIGLAALLASLAFLALPRGERYLVRAPLVLLG